MTDRLRLATEEGIYRTRLSARLSLPSLYISQVCLYIVYPQGHYGEVRLAWLKSEAMDDGCNVAVKCLKPQSGQDFQSLWNEIEKEAAIMFKLDHPNIVKMIGVCRSSKFSPIICQLTSTVSCV